MAETRAQRALIIGASRGIGLELVRQYLEQGWEVHATTRTPDQPGLLGELQGHLTIHPFEVRDATQLAVLARFGRIG